MNTNRQIVELGKFKKSKRKVYVDWKNSLVNWKDYTFRITYKNVGGIMCPYVIIEDIKPMSEIKPLIKHINVPKHKKYLKYCDYELDNHTYFVCGIGNKSIKVNIDDDFDEDVYLFYNTTLGQRLLSLLANEIEQTVFDTENGEVEIGE